MATVIKAEVISGRYKGEKVRITNISVDEMGRQKAACFLANGTRANIPMAELSVIEDRPIPEPEIRAKISMPFVSGSSSSRTLTHTKNMGKNKVEVKSPTPSTKITLAKCETCGAEYNLEDRKGMPGKLTDCETCANETESKVEGKMIFSHKTGSTIEILKDGELKHQAETFDPKNKS
ncbi:MAG TPA: hypothetical protein VNJ08_12330 [Bacteriovoracaceae bacterium]|nr:hypothetical protein [Bacteriovoracaceae bacterium]